MCQYEGFKFCLDTRNEAPTLDVAYPEPLSDLSLVVLPYKQIINPLNVSGKRLLKNLCLEFLSQIQKPWEDLITILANIHLRHS
jgi:hypothetical protein